MVQLHALMYTTLVITTISLAIYHFTEVAFFLWMSHVGIINCWFAVMFHLFNDLYTKRKN